MRVKLKKNITIHKIQNNLSLFDGENSTLYTFNKSAAFILNGIKLGWEKSKIIQDLKEQFMASEQEAKEDYQSILDFLNEKKMFEEPK